MDAERGAGALVATLDAVLRLELAPVEHLGYRPGGWTAREILAHLADVELVNLWRFCRAVTVDGGAVDVFDENGWARELAYAERPLELSRALFAAARRTLIHHLGTIPADVLEQGGAVHAEKGRLSPRAWAELVAGHTRHHLGQLEAILSSRPWTPPVVTADSWRYTGRRPPR